ncbi:MAG: DNA primase catalytic subunit PriS [Candidatus Micrarchaeia archaeon]
MAGMSDVALVKRIFVSYYEGADLAIPGIEKREFGFGNMKKIDARHLNFASAGEFRRYLTSNTPLFVSHSTSYYEFPGATPIQKKVWRGADLVFDLDIHAEGKFGAYAKLAEVKGDLVRLVKDFIKGDFGIKDEHIAMVFSGNRGYHVHVRDPAYFPLGGEERRELVDYVMGQGLDYLQFFSFDDKKRLLGPRPDEGGYRGRFARAAIETLRTKPLALSKKFTNEKDREFFISGINEGNWSKTTLNLKDMQERLAVVAKDLPISSVDTDVGVTQDLSKLIRVPNSIHGETGLVARVIRDVERFDPWRDASLKEGPPLSVRFTEDVPRLDHVFGGLGPYKKDSGIELPQEQAIFFVLKGSAVFDAEK